ncbi:MAG: hypothetical protein ABSH13_24585, partial [Candidatus Acidiferrum sp.]
LSQRTRCARQRHALEPVYRSPEIEAKDDAELNLQDQVTKNEGRKDGRVRPSFGTVTAKSIA